MCITKAYGFDAETNSIGKFNNGSKNKLATAVPRFWEI